MIDRVTYVALLLAAALLAACGGDSGEEQTKKPFEALWKLSSTVGYEKSQADILLNGNEGTEWTAQIVEGATWCSFHYQRSESTQTGMLSGPLNVLYVYYAANSGTEQREAKIKITTAGQPEQVLYLTQLAREQQNLPAFGLWPELPSEKADANYQYVTHYAKLNDKTVRNFSLCFDKTKRAALWVAYPIHKSYVGSVGRTDAWAFDPVLSSGWQPDCIARSYRGNYDRGHQIPSGDRQANAELNAQTFYMSNMTPQLDRLNQDMWAKLETGVRQNSCSDTLFVVTGAYFGPNAGTTTDGAGNTVAVPTHYYKVLLRTKTGTTGKAVKNCSDLELKSIGFWVEHRSYGNVAPPRSICTTVADIEAKTKFTFFPQVSDAVKKQSDPSSWGIN